MIAVYLLLGLGLLGGLFWALAQITVRQRLLQAEFTRLEQLSAEVAINGEALLDRADDRIAALGQMLTASEAVAKAGTQAKGKSSGKRVQEAVAKTAPAPKAKRKRPSGSAEMADPLPLPPKSAPLPLKSAPLPPKSAPLPLKSAPLPPKSAPPLTPLSHARERSRYQELQAAAASLSDQGTSISEIAQQLGLPRGEVELLLNIRAKQDGA